MERITDLAELRAAYLALAQGARYSLFILSRDLEPGIMGLPEFSKQAKNLVLGNRYARIRLLVHDSAVAVKSGHRMIELARRLSSFIEIRRLGSDDQLQNEAFAVADESLIVYRSQADRYEAECGEDRARARQLTQQFEELWSRSMPDPEVRRLHL